MLKAYLLPNIGYLSVREKIRTPGLLIRSQTLYPAELRAQFCTFLFLSVPYLMYYTVEFSKKQVFFQKSEKYFSHFILSSIAYKILKCYDNMYVKNDLFYFYIERKDILMKALKRELSTTQIIALGFFCVIFIGTLLLCLPISAADGRATPFIDALFTSTTSVCVTGLVVVQTSLHWSIFGQIVILILIQLGGLGVISFSTAVMMVIGRRITLKDRLLLEDAMNLNTLSGLVKFLRQIFKGTAIIEGIGMLGYAIVFVPKYGLRGIWISIFTSISAFCNAGIDIIGANSLGDYLTHPWANVVTMFLIIMGGIGFIVWMDVVTLIKDLKQSNIPQEHCLRRLHLHTKLVLIMTACLILGGGLLIFILEYNNPETIGHLGIIDKIVASLFESVTTRTAGFLTFSQTGLRPTTVLICLVLMFIGGSSIGTAGGVKTSTVALLILSAISTIKGERHVVVFRRNIPHTTIKKAFAVIMVSGLALFTGIILLYQAEGGSMLDIAFEATSAIATVGLSRDLTPTLHLAGKLIIVTLMYLGRIGPLSMAIVFGNRKQKGLVSYPEEDITVG